MALITRADGDVGLRCRTVFESTEKPEIGAPPCGSSPPSRTPRPDPRYLDLAETLVKIFNGAPAADQRALWTRQATTLLSETTSFPPVRSDGSRLTTLVFRSPGEYALRSFVRSRGWNWWPRPAIKRWCSRWDVLSERECSRRSWAPCRGTSRAQRSLLSESLAPLLAAHRLSVLDLLGRAAQGRRTTGAFSREDGRSARTVKGRCRSPWRSGWACLELEIDVPAVLQPNALYTLKVEWVRAGGYDAGPGGKTDCPAFALGAFDGPFREQPTSFGVRPSGGKIPVAQRHAGGLAARPCSFAGPKWRQRAADPELMELLRGTEWVFTNTRSGKYLWEDPFDDQRWEFHGVGNTGGHRVRRNVVDGVGVVVVFEYEGRTTSSRGFKIYSHLSAAVRRQWPKREIQLFPQRGCFPIRTTSRGKSADCVPSPRRGQRGGAPNSPEKCKGPSSG